MIATRQVAVNEELNGPLPVLVPLLPGGTSQVLGPTPVMVEDQHAPGRLRQALQDGAVISEVQDEYQVSPHYVWRRLAVRNVLVVGPIAKLQPGSECSSEAIVAQRVEKHQ